MFCKNCGNELKENEKFCSNCGTAITEDDIKIENSSKVDETTSTSTNSTSTSTSTSSSKSNKNGLATASMILGIIAICFAFIPDISGITFILSVLSLVFVIVVFTRKKRNGKSIAGLVLSIIALLIIFVSGSDTSNTTLNKNSNTINRNSTNTTDTTNQTSKNSIKEFKLNEPIIVSRGSQEYTVTFEGIRETAERNQFSEITPNKVIFVDYNYENISFSEDVYVYDGYYKLLDDSGNVLDTYPVSDYTRNNKSVPIGGKSQGCDAYAIMTDTKTITLLYYDYGSKPLGKIVINL